MCNFDKTYRTLHHKTKAEPKNIAEPKNNAEQGLQREYFRREVSETWEEDEDKGDFAMTAKEEQEGEPGFFEEGELDLNHRPHYTWEELAERREAEKMAKMKAEEATTKAECGEEQEEQEPATAASSSSALESGAEWGEEQEEVEQATSYNWEQFRAKIVKAQQASSLR